MTIPDRILHGDISMDNVNDAFYNFTNNYYSSLFPETTSATTSTSTTTASTIRQQLYSAPPMMINLSHWHEASSSSSTSNGSENHMIRYNLGGSGDADTFVEAHKEFVFDRTDVRVVFITLYSLVFCCCFFGECRAVE